MGVMIMKKLRMKFFSILLSFFCVIGLGTPIYAEGETGYFAFKENDVRMHIGDQYQIQYDISDDIMVKDVSIEDDGAEYIDYDKDTRTITAKNYGNVRIDFVVGTDDDSTSCTYQFYVSVGEEATGFKWYSNSNTRVINTSVEGYSSTIWISGDYSVQPDNIPAFYDTLKFEIDDPDGVVTQDSDDQTCLVANHSGTFNVTGIVDDKYSDTAEYHVLMGNYVEGVDTTWITKLLKVGETFDLKNDLLQHLYPKNADFSDEKFEFKKSYETSALELNDGVVKGENYGSEQVVTTLANGTQIIYNITIADEPTWIAFDQKEYSYSQSSGVFLKDILTSDNNNSIQSVSANQITYSVDNNDVAEINNEYIRLKKAGDVTVTAKYKELTASCVMHVYEGDDPYAFERSSGYNIKLHAGKSKKVDYKLGSKNSIEKIAIQKNNQDVDDTQAKFEKNTQMFTAYEDGYYDLTLTDKLGKTNSWSIYTGPEATSFRFYEKERIYTTRDASSDNSNYVAVSFEPYNASQSTEVKYDVIEGDADVIEWDTSSNDSEKFRIKKAGKVTIKGTTDNGLSDTMIIDARVGNYATDFDYEKDLKYLLKAGETISIKDDVESALLPKGKDLSDEKLTYSIPDYYNQGVVNVSRDGTITALENGSTTIQVSTVGGKTKSINVAVADKINGFAFKQSNIEIDLTKNNNSSAISERQIDSDLVTNPIYVQKIIKYDEVKFTSSNPEVGEVYMNGRVPVFRGYNDGVTTITAEYQGFTTTMDIDVYTPTPATSMDIPSEITIHKGFLKSIEPIYNTHAIKTITAEMTSGDDIASVSVYDNGFTVEANKVGTAVVKVTSASNPKLTKTVKVNVIDGYPDADVSIISESTGEEFTSSGAYSLKVNQVYFIHVKSKSDEYPIYDEFDVFDQIDESEVLGNVQAVLDLLSEYYIPFKTVKSGTVTLEEVYPGKKVTLRVGETGFIDTPADTPHNDDVQWLASSGISTGYPDGTFRPYVEVARCDMAAFIRRLAKNNNWLDAATWTPSEADWNTFSDIDKNSPHAEDVLWLAHAEISQGWDVGNGQKEFRPLAIVARCDMAAFLHRLASKVGVSDASTWKPSEADWTFADIDADSPHAEDVLWLAHSEVSKGWDESNGTKTFRPLTNVARCDMAAFLHRLDNLK